MGAETNLVQRHIMSSGDTILDSGKWGHRFLTGDDTTGLIDLLALRMMISESQWRAILIQPEDEESVCTLRAQTHADPPCHPGFALTMWGSTVASLE